MKLIILILLTSMVISCGKKSESDDEKTVTTTPPISADEPGQEVHNESFSVTVGDDSINAGEAVILKIKNIGKLSLDHTLFSFGSAPSLSVINNLNCYSELNPEGECLYSVMFNNPKTKHQKIFVTYDERISNIKVELNIEVEINEENPEIHFLYRKEHTYTDCEKLFKWSRFGQVHTVHRDDVCQVRAEFWNSDKKVEIAMNPLTNYEDPVVDSNEYYCGKGWTIHSFQFEEAEVEEVKNIFGSKRWITIPPGESREVCVKHGLFSCKTKRVFFSRLVATNCY